MKTNLVEINYSFELLNNFEALLLRRKISNRLLNFLSESYDICSLSFADFEGASTINDIKYICWNKKLTKLSIPISKHLSIKRMKPSIVLVHGINNFFQIMHLKVCLGNNVKIIVQHHAEKPTGLIKKVLLKMSSWFVDAYLFTSIQTAIELGISKRKVYELMEGSSELVSLNKHKSRELLKIPSEKTIYLWVGRLVDIKNPLFFIRGFNAFSKKKENVVLYLIYNDDALLKQCKEICPENENIVYVGPIDHISINAWYSAADFFVSASHYEGSGYALCEAMSCGLVPIINDIASFNFMSINGECAIQYKSNDDASLSEALHKSLVVDKNDLKEKVRARFTEKLSYRSIAEEFSRIEKNL